MKARGAGIIPAKKVEKSLYTFGQVSVNPGLVSFLYKHPKKVVATSSSTMGSVNLATIQSLMKTLGILTWFLKTHVYPAFKGPSTLEEGAIHSYDTIEGFMTLKRKAGISVPRAKKPRLDEDALMDEDEGDVDGSMIEEILFGDSASRIPKAKPSTIPPSVWGSTTQMPTLPGLVFPYFEGMISNDTAFVSEVIQQYFLESLGNTRDEVLSGFKDLKLRMGMLSSTATGRMLQHLFLGVKLAIQGQARLFPIFRGTDYVGFTLHGWYFSVSIDGYKHVPLVYEKLVSEVADIDLHNVALSRIVQKIAGSKRKDTGKLFGKAAALEFKQQITSPRQLAMMLSMLRLDEKEKDSIEELANQLAFPQRFWPLDPEHILRAIDHLVARTTLPETEPLYTRGGVLTTLSLDLSIFSVFGDQAFSLRIPGGESRKIPKDVASDTLFKPYSGKNQKQVVPRPNIVIAKKNLSLCVEDWKALMVDRCVHLKQSRDSMFRSVVFGGERARTFWVGLIERIGPLDDTVGKDYFAKQKDLGEDVIEESIDDLADFL
jgi:hypothetical protein